MFDDKQKKMIDKILAHHGFEKQLIKTVMCKVALEITTISEATKKKADEWLEANNFAKGIWR